MLPADPVFILAAAIFFGVCLVAAWSDLRRRVVPNRLIAVLALCAPLLMVAGRMPPAAFFVSLALALAVLLLGSQLFARGWVGGGDVKLICALMLWFPPVAALWFIYVALVLGGGLALIVLAVRLAVRRGLVPVGAAQRRLLEDRLCVPYAVSIGAAAGISFWMSWL